MQGLLDWIKTPDGQGLLGMAAGYASGAQRGTPWNNAGRGGLAGLLAYGQAGDRQNKLAEDISQREVRAMQIKGLQSEIASREAALQKTTEGMSFMKNLLGGASYQPGQLGSGSLGAVDSPAPFAAPSARGLSAATPEQVAMAKHYGYDLLEPWKIAKQGLELKPGHFRLDPTTGKREYIPDPSKGVAFDGQTVSALPGFHNFTTAQTMATEAPKTLLSAAANVNLRKTAQGTEIPVSALDENPTLQNILQQFLGGRSGVGAPTGAVPAPVQPTAAMPPAGAPGRPMIAPADQKAADAESIRMIQSELAKPSIPQDQRAGMEKELQRLAASQGQNGFPTPTLQRPTTGYGMTVEQQAAAEAAKVRATEAAKADVARDTGKQTDNKHFNQMQMGVTRAIDLLSKGPTGSGFGRAVDSTAAWFGKSTEGAELGQQLKVLSGWLTSNVPRMEGPQSDRDVLQYKEMAALVGDDSIPVARRLAAANELKSMQQKYAKLNGWTGKPEGSWGDEPKANATGFDPGAIAAELARRKKL